MERAALTCVSCHIASFESADAHREHYRSDYHRFNIKRKVTGLAPLSLAAFESRVDKFAQASAQASAQQHFHAVCDVCKKRFSSENAQRSHLASRKHIEAAARVRGEDSPLTMQAKVRGAAAVATVVDEEEEEEEEGEGEEEDDSVEPSSDEENESSEAFSGSEWETDSEEEAEEEEPASTPAVQSAKGKKKTADDGLDPYERERRKQAAIRAERERKLAEEAAREAARQFDDAARAAAAGRAERERLAHEADAELAANPMTEEEAEALVQATIDARPPLAEGECLFCRKQFKSFKSLGQHVTKKHSFYLPDIDYLVDPRGMYDYLAYKVAKLCQCLNCNKTFRSLEAVRGHMADKGHQLLKYDDTTGDYDDFYDFSSSYGDVSEELAGRVDEELTPRELAIIARKMGVGKDIQVADSGLELVLESGATIGHRSLARYYKQNLRPDREIVKGLKMTYKMIGEANPGMRRQDKSRKDIAKQNYAYMKTGVRANKLQGRYFRNQNPL